MPPLAIPRRRLLKGAAALGGANLAGLAGCATAPLAASPTPATGRPAPTYPPLAPIRASWNRIFDITVCIRPFRAAGPRLDTEMVGDTLVVHNYGHGGSGWSLSWGSATVAVEQAMARSPAEVAVLGCGALGLTAAIVAQRAGAKVTLYARDLMPDTRSARATGTWTPDSRIALADKAAPGFAALWERMARISYHTYRSYLGLPGTPVEWQDRYYLSGGPTPPDAAAGAPVAAPAAPALEFASYEHLIRDIEPGGERLDAAATPFPVRSVYRSSSMTFNIADYGHTLMADFLAGGGRFERREFHAPGELAALNEKVVINCPGYAARELWKDESVIPVRGQITWLIPQPEVSYGVVYDGVNVVPRRDGIVLQMLEGGDMRGYGDTNETPDKAEAKTAVERVAALYAKFGTAAA
jgi:glycine/D-amino acid oxidase-like deaminating enzyme